ALLRGDDQRVEGGGLAFARGRRLLRGGGGGEAGQRGGDRPGQHVAMRVVTIHGSTLPSRLDVEPVPKADALLASCRGSGVCRVPRSTPSPPLKRRAPARGAGTAAGVHRYRPCAARRPAADGSSG